MKSKAVVYKRSRLKTRFTLATFIMPALLLTVVFFFIPVILTVILSLTSMDYRFNWDFVGIQNFIDMFRDFMIKGVIKNTIIYVAFTLAFFNVGLSLVLSILTTSIGDRGGTIFRLIWMMPRLTPSVVYGLLWLWIFDPTKYGLINGIRSALFNGGRTY